MSFSAWVLQFDFGLLGGLASLTVLGAVLLSYLVVRLRLALQHLRDRPSAGSTGAALCESPQVRRREQDYLQQRRAWARRQLTSVPPGALSGPPIAVALSGGGIRSATTCLGVLQRLARLEILPAVDYLSTVSGGGYAGAALSSLLSHRAESPEKDGAEEHPLAVYQIPADPDGAGPKARFDTLTHFPFSSGSPPAGAAAGERLDGDSILAHLRQHGDFLMRYRSPIHRDVLRTGGVLTSSVLYHLLLFFLVLLVGAAPFLLLVEWLTGSVAGLADVSFSGYLEGLLFWGPGAGLHIPGLIAALGVVLVSATALWLRWWLWVYPWTPPGTTAPDPFRRPLTSVEDNRQYHALWALFCALVTGSLASLVGLRTLVTREPQPALLLVPAALAAGGVLVVLVASLWVRSLDYGRNERSRLNSLQGLTLWFFAGTVGFALLPWLPSWVASNVGLLVSSVAGWVGSLGLGRLLLQRLSAGGTGKADQGGELPGSLLRTAFSLLAAVLVVVGFVLACCVLLLAQPHVAPPLAFYSWAGIALAAALVVVGCLVDANRLAFHFFYRDRLAEAFLQTSGPAASTGTGGGAARSRRREHIELLRDDADMPLTHLHGVPAGATRPAESRLGDVLSKLNLGPMLGMRAPQLVWLDSEGRQPPAATPERPQGEDDGPPASATTTATDTVSRRSSSGTGDGGGELPPQDAATAAPYHLLVAALNLTHSQDLALRSRRAAPFLFSKLYCGSEVTGFVDTRVYRDASTTLATAMTLSGAAASTAMGARTFFGQSLLMALFGLRLGLWLRNPGYKEGQKADRREGWPFWPGYLLREMLGLTDATRPLINLSDGNHTGDNLGLVPLLERRCRLIVAVDAEMDPDHDFGSLAEALRQAEIDLDLEYDLDLDAVRLPSSADADQAGGESQRHVVIGVVKYRQEPDGRESDPEPASHPVPAKRGWLVVIKNSVTGDEPEPVVTYRRQNPAFPHESTADQFFSEAQQESYRQLGWHMVKKELPPAVWTVLLDGEPGDDWRERIRQAREAPVEPSTLPSWS